MKIVVLDGYAANPGDLSWAGLEELGQCAVHDRTPYEKVVERAADADAVLTNKTVLDADNMAKLDRLKYIGVLATGVNVVDLDAAAKRGIVVTNVPAYSTNSVAQLVFAHTLELCHHLGAHSDGARSSKWASSPDFCYWDYPLIELHGLAMGIVGYGSIGRRVAEIARAFGMNVLVSTRTVPATPQEGCRFVDLDALFAQADVVSLNCPLTPETEGMVNAERIQKMKKTALLVNTARGPLVDEQALADALNAGRIAGAGVDVLSTEPPSPGNPLLKARNCFVTPHFAWATEASRKRLMETAVANVKAFAADKPVNVVN